MLGVLHPARRKNEGKNLGRKHLELSKRRRALARKKLRGKRAERKAACKKHKAARPRSRLDELSSRSTRSTFAQQPSTALTVIDSINTLPRPCAAKGCDVIGLQETKRGGTSELMASGYGVFFHGDCSGVKGRKGQHGAGLVIKEDFVKKAGEDDIGVVQRLKRAGMRRFRPRGGSPKHPLPEEGLHYPLHSRQACPESNSFHHGVGQICPR